MTPRTMTPAAAIFPGQLSERVGMGRRLAQRSPAAARVLDDACAKLGTDFQDVLFHGPAERLGQPLYAQAGVTTVGMMAFAALREAAIEVTATAGYSLGVLAALNAAGSLQAAEVLDIVLLQYQLYERYLGGFDGAMAAITGVDADRLIDLCAACTRPDEPVDLGGRNNATQLVVTGSRAAVERVIDRVRPTALDARRLAIHWPVHSSLMRPVAQALAVELPALIKPRPPRLRVYSPIDGLPIDSADAALDISAHEIAQPVRWDLVVRNLERDGLHRFFECGPGRQVGPMLRWSHRRARVDWVGEGWVPEAIGEASLAGS